MHICVSVFVRYQLKIKGKIEFSYGAWMQFTYLYYKHSLDNTLDRNDLSKVKCLGTKSMRIQAKIVSHIRQNNKSQKLMRQIQRNFVWQCVCCAVHVSDSSTRPMENQPFRFVCNDRSRVASCSTQPKTKQHAQYAKISWFKAIYRSNFARKWFWGTNKHWTL